MNRTTRRVLLYAAGVTVLAGLGYAGFLYDPPPDAMIRLEGARTLAVAGNFEAALDVCDLVATEHPGSFEERLFRAAILAQAERYEEALDVYDAVLAAAPDPGVRRDLLLDRASVLLALGRHEDVDAARAELAEDPRDHRPHLLDATMAEREGRWVDAIEAYGAAGAKLAADEQDTSWVDARRVRSHMLAARAARDAGHLRAAADHFDEAAALAPESVLARMEGARVWLQAGMVADAIARVEQAHAIDPRAVERELQNDASWELLRDDERIRALSRNETTADEAVCPPLQEG